MNLLSFGSVPKFSILNSDLNGNLTQPSYQQIGRGKITRCVQLKIFIGLSFVYFN